MKTNLRISKVALMLSMMLAFAAHAQDGAGMSVVDENSRPETIQLNEAAANEARENSRQGMDTANQAREQRREFGQERAEQAREKGEGMRQQMQDRRGAPDADARSQMQQRPETPPRPGRPER